MTPNRSSTDDTSATGTWDDSPWADAEELHGDLTDPIEVDGGPSAGSPAQVTADAGVDASADTEPLARRPRRKLVTPVTGALAAVILVAGGFAGGVTVQKGRDGGGATASAGAPSGMGGVAGGGMPSGMGFPGGGPSATGGTAGQSGGAGGTASPQGGQAAGSAAAGQGTSSASGGTTVGEVANVKGGTIYVTTSDGTTVRVVAADGGTVQRTSKTAMTEVHPGDSVVVTGSTKSDGTVSATAVTATASGVSSAGGFGGRP